VYRSDIIVETERLRLRTLRPSDAAFVLELTSDPDFVRYIGDKGLRSLDDARAFIASGPWTCQPREGYGQFVVERRVDDLSVGLCGLLHRPKLDVTDIGLAVLAEHRGHGYASEAAAAIFAYARSTLDLAHIVGLTIPGNAASIRILEKLGLRFDHLLEHDTPIAIYR